MKTTAFFVTTATALTMAFQANAADLCLDNLSYDTERYSQAMRIAMNNRAENFGQSFSVAAYSLDLSMACDSLEPDANEIKDCLNVAAKVENEIGMWQSRYWRDLRNRLVTYHDRNICLPSRFNYD